ncbi:HlyD family efflux transporter periplasmic adaptor subunit [Patescibacteria group bacterium]|nr:HlyD family efflux transporter periplasmic adaptor subunit [Patescibacteria group bacterium]
MMKHYKRVLYIILAVSVVGIVVVLVNANGEEPAADVKQEEFAYNVKTMTVESGLEYSFDISGNVSVGQSAVLPAEARASVVQVLVKPGEKVEKGATLVQLYSDSLESSYQNTAIMLANAQVSYATNQAVSGNSIEIERLRFQNAEQNYKNTITQNEILKSQAEQGLNSAKLNVDLSTNSAQTALETAQKSYDKTKAINDSNEQVARIGLANSIRSTQTDIFNGLNTSNELLEVSPLFRENINIDTELIGRRGETEKREAEAALKVAINEYVALDISYVAMASTSRATEDALQKTLVVLNYTDATSNLPASVISGYVQTISQQLAMLRGDIAAMDSANQALQTTLAANEASITGVKQQIEAAKNALAQTKQQSGDTSQLVINAEKQYQATLAQLKSAEDNAKANVDTAKLSYDNAKKTTNLSVISAKNALLTTQDAMDQIKLQREKLTIKAPFAGQVSNVMVNLGDEVNPGSQIVSVENPETLKIAVQLSDQDIERIAVGDEVGLGNSTGTIISISPSADAITKKYAVEILPSTEEYKLGQFVTVNFLATKPDSFNKIFIPIATIHLGANENFVWGLKDDRTVKFPIVLGDLQGEYVEVIEGLKSGDEMIADGGRIIENEGALVKTIAW